MSEVQERGLQACFHPNGLCVVGLVCTHPLITAAANLEGAAKLSFLSVCPSHARCLQSAHLRQALPYRCHTHVCSGQLLGLQVKGKPLDGVAANAKRMKRSDGVWLSAKSPICTVCLPDARRGTTEEGATTTAAGGVVPVTPTADATADLPAATTKDVPEGNLASIADAAAAAAATFAGASTAAVTMAEGSRPPSSGHAAGTPDVPQSATASITAASGTPMASPATTASAAVTSAAPAHVQAPQSTWQLQAGIAGKLLCVNKRIAQEPTLLLRRPHAEGHLAVVALYAKEHEQAVASLLGADAFAQLRGVTRVSLDTLRAVGC